MTKIFRVSLLWDIFYLLILTAVSLFLISFYFKAHYLNTGYPDWMVHAFRVKFIQQYGFASWTHFWSNGISVLKAYQFIPHYITLYTSELLHVDIPRAMVILTIVQFVLLRLFIYGTMRLLKFSSITAFICSLLSFDIGQYWGGVSDYTLLFGSTLFPLVIFLWVKYYNGKLLYFFPYLCGVLIYVHPLLGFYSIGLWLCGVIFSDRRIVSISTLSQLGLFLTSSSLFWFPIVFKSSYSYSSNSIANNYFLGMVLSGYDYYGLSIFLLVCLFLSVIRSFMPINASFKWSTPLLAFIMIVFVLIFVGIHLPLPKFIAQFQYTRGITMVGIAIVFAFGMVVENAKKIKVVIIKGVLIFLFSLSLIEGMWFISVHSPAPATNQYDPISFYLKSHGSQSLNSGRVWSSDIGNSSYLAPLSIRMPYSYMGHLESNQIPPRINPLIVYHPYIDDVPAANLQRIDDYFKITNTKYIFFDETSPFTRALTDPNKSAYINGGKIEIPDSIFHLFKTAWNVEDSILINKKYKSAISHFPFNLEFSNVNDQIELDDYVHNFVQVLYKPENKPLKVSYPTQESVQIQIPPKRDSALVYLDESYDSNWKAYFNNRVQTIAPSGPNYMLITLDNLSEGGTVILKHSWPTSFYVSIFLIILIPCEMAIMKIVSLSLRGVQRRSNPDKIASSG